MRGIGFPSSLGTDGWTDERDLDVDVESAAAVRDKVFRGQTQGRIKPESSENEAVA